MVMEGWRKLEARDDKALGRDDQDMLCLGLRHSTAKEVERQQFVLCHKRGRSSRQERAKSGARHPLISLRE